MDQFRSTLLKPFLGNGLKPLLSSLERPSSTVGHLTISVVKLNFYLAYIYIYRERERKRKFCPKHLPNCIILGDNPYIHNQFHTHTDKTNKVHGLAMDIFTFRYAPYRQKRPFQTPSK